jgi:predicted nucleic acid-binding protein
MKADVFLDSNVLLYAAANVQTEAAKKETSLRLIAETDFGTSVQVLGEFFDNARRKARLCIPERTMREILNLLRTRPLVEETVKLFERSVALAERYQVRYYDAAILAAALELGCETLFTEDLADGQNYSGVSVVNPFRNR